MRNCDYAQVELCRRRIMRKWNYAQIELGASPIMHMSNYAQVGFHYTYGRIDTCMQSSPFEIQIPAHWNLIG